MRLVRSCLVLAALVLAVLPPAAAQDPPAQEVFRLGSAAINESSGLVDLGRLMVTMNDSGGDAVLDALDARTGKTIGSTSYADAVLDVEALAPAGPQTVWAADIGDNLATRKAIKVYRVPIGAGSRRVTASSYDLIYPDGPHDAESLIAGPAGRLYVITKGLLGGTVYAAPKRLDPEKENRLTPVAGVSIWATDAALLPGGRFAIVRGYTSAGVYSFPDFAPVGSFALPEQRQGEGISVGPNGRIRLSSEGVHSPVLQVPLPAALAEATRPVTTPPPATTTRATPAPAHPQRSRGASWWPIGGSAIVVAGVVVLLLRRRNRGASR